MDRQKLFEEIANTFLSEYNKIRALKLDTGLKGSASENILKEWIEKWLPKRISLKNGAVISVDDGPTNQMDCLLFDNFESPVFHHIGNVEILPVEGVLGAVEVNFGESTPYSKIQTDCEKLSKLAELSLKKLQRASQVYAHITNEKIENYTAAEAQASIIHHVMPQISKPLLLIFAEDIQGDLSEVAKRIHDHNKKVGIPLSVDGLFVLKQGIALHIHERNLGWNTYRLQGNKFGYLKTNQGRILSLFQNIILQNLYNYGKIYPSFDQYIGVTGQAQKEMEDYTEVSDKEYKEQTDRPNIVKYGTK